jgi:CHASE2 domain-containing sensor protein
VDDLLLGSKNRQSLWDIPRNLKLFFYGGLITFALALCVVFSPFFLQYANNKSYDILTRNLPAPQTSEVPLIVGIDDQSLMEYGQWPWPRYILSRLIQKIGDHGAAGIAVDIMFPEPDRTSLSVVFDEMSREWGGSFSDTKQISPQMENDRVFEKALLQTPSVLGYQFVFDSMASSNEEVLHPLKYSFRERTRHRKCRFLSPQSVIHSLPLLMNAAGASGFINALTDSDGILRRVPLIMDYNGKAYPSLSLASLIRAFGDHQVRIEAGEDGFYIDWKKRRIPLDCSGFFWVRHRDMDHPFPYISAADILSDRKLPVTVNGKIVFIGVNASGMGDRHLLPQGSMAHGLEVHASMINNILVGDFLRRPAWAPGAELVLMVAAGILSSVALALGGALWCLVFTIVAGFVSVALFYWILLTYGIFLSPVMPVSILVINFALLNSIKYGFEEIALRQRSKELIMSQDVAILSLSALVETRDKETGHHILRTQRYVQTLAKRLRRLPKYKKILDDQTIELLYKSAPLHDIGKVGIPDRILAKSGKLSDEEFEIIKTHTIIGGRTMKKSEKMLGGNVDIPYLKYAYDMAISHHEKWDGSGYPYGLAGDAIPLAGRLMALADVYDALVSKRIYKAAFSHESAREMILHGKGQHFDPDVVDAFIAEEESFQSICMEFADAE